MSVLESLFQSQSQSLKALEKTRWEKNLLASMFIAEPCSRRKLERVSGRETPCSCTDSMHTTLACRRGEREGVSEAHSPSVGGLPLLLLSGRWWQQWWRNARGEKKKARECQRILTSFFESAAALSFSPLSFSFSIAHSSTGYTSGSRIRNCGEARWLRSSGRRLNRLDAQRLPCPSPSSSGGVRSPLSPLSLSSIID